MKSKIKTALQGVTLIEAGVIVCIMCILESIAQPLYSVTALMVALTVLVSFYLIIGAGFDVIIIKRKP